MIVRLFSIEKSDDEGVERLMQHYTKMIGRYATFETHTLFNKQIAIAQNASEKEAKRAYTKAYEPYLKGYTIALDPKGEMVDSEGFSQLFEQGAGVHFFIGGAYGFEEAFLSQTQKIISLSRLTYAHKIAKVVLMEQIYRGLCIKNNHPYHK